MSKQEGNIIWLASYPKSGNTWLRIFLNNLLSDSDEPVDINALHETGSIASSRSIFDELVGINSADLTIAEIDYYLPQVHQLRSDQFEEKQFIKIHDALTKNKEGKLMIPLDATCKVIYLIRNPLDVCVSFAHHSGHTNFDKMIKQMADPQMALARSSKGQNKQIHQYMDSWSNHVNSWTQNVPAKKLLVVRYEDMKQKTKATFSQIVDFVGLDYSLEQITDALEKSKIERLQKIEGEKGFREKSQRATMFFRKGIIGSWQAELTNKQVQQILQDHDSVMKRYNYKMN